jgi:hypothetical protein
MQSKVQAVPLEVICYRELRLRPLYASMIRHHECWYCRQGLTLEVICVRGVICRNISFERQWEIIA